MAVTPTAVWELKCVDALRGEHFLQLAIYAWLWEAGGSRLLRGPRDFRLANLLTGEAVRARSTLLPPASPHPPPACSCSGRWLRTSAR